MRQGLHQPRLVGLETYARTLQELGEVVDDTERPTMSGMYRGGEQDSRSGKTENVGHDAVELWFSSLG